MSSFPREAIGFTIANYVATSFCAGLISASLDIPRVRPVPDCRSACSRTPHRQRGPAAMTKLLNYLSQGPQCRSGFLPGAKA